jgi:hypothetical protein
VLPFSIHLAAAALLSAGAWASSAEGCGTALNVSSSSSPKAAMHLVSFLGLLDEAEDAILNAMVVVLLLGI